MGHKEFDTATLPEEGPSFAIAGRKIRCVAQPPFEHVQQVVRAQSGDWWAAPAMADFIGGVIVKDDRKMWGEVSRLPEVGVEQVAPIFAYLVEEYFTRPTSPPSGSLDGRSET